MKTLLIIFLLFLSVTAFGQTNTDEEQINKLISEMTDGFNTHNFASLEKNSTEDVNWVNIVGMWWKGRREVVGAHYGIFNTIFKGVKFEKKSVKTRFITKDAAIANVVIHVGEFYPPDGIDHGNNKKEAADDILTLVYVKRDGKWLLTAGQNTVIDPRAVPPANMKNK